MPPGPPPSSVMPWQTSWIPAFLEFVKRVKVPSKEMVEPAPIIPYEAQYRFLRELDMGLTADQHFFVVLKARQLGLSTVMLLLDVFWLYMHPGLQGALVADTDENRIQFRETLTQVLSNLPHGFRIRVKRHNRGALVLENDSRLQYLVAGKGKNPDLGRSRGLNFLHATESSGWGDQQGVYSLIDALATENPNRLYIFESTAKGYNSFHTICQKAKSDPEQHFMFIGWWAKEVYRIKAGTAEYDRWWTSNPQLSEQEQLMEDQILQDYNWQLTTEQWAWWRKQSFDRSETNLLQEFPWHEKVAFQVTGSPFFANKRLAADLEFVSTQNVTFNGYRYELPSDFTLMRCEQVFKADEAELKIWEPPIRGARYAIGVDVAYGRSDEADRHCIEIYRCFADKLVQVAEWATPLPETRHVAWVLAHLAGSYRDCIINLEISGPGAQVMQEMKHLRQLIQYAHLRDMQPSFEARGALDQARWFLFHRPESMAPGYTYGWKTTNENKLEMFNGFRDGYNTEQVVVRSVKLLQEMQTLIQNGVKIGGSAGKKDDRPFASGLADYAWRHWIRPDMLSRNETFARQKAAEKSLSKEGQNVVRGIIPAFFASCDKERRERAIQEILNRSY